MFVTGPGGFQPLMAPEASGFLPHGYCYLWNKPLLVTHVASDLLIGLSYVAISFSLAWLVHRARRDIPFSVAFVAFGLFIITCALTHFVEVWTLWKPVYWFSGGVKVLTAAASVGTAIAMPFWVPRVHMTIREAKVARQRELADERARVLEESNQLLQDQAIELEQQREEAQLLAAQLAAANRDLRHALAEAESTRIAADEARQIAEEANRTKGEFLAVMSHELRTPLNAVIGYTDLIMMGIPDPVTEGQTMKLKRIRGSARHLVGLVEQVLGFARIESGTEHVEIENTDAAVLARETLSLAEPLVPQGAVTLDIEVEKGDLRMQTDPAKVRQILLNLLSNAIKFTPEGRVSLRVLPETDGIRFEVSDTGIGIAPEHHRRIFEPFWQVAQGHTRVVGGTGLGLAVVRELVGKLGGTVAVESRESAGSRFVTWLPRRQAAHEGS